VVLVGNGHYLCGTGQNHAAERLIKRRFLTKVEVDDWIVVVITPENVEALREAQRRCRLVWRQRRRCRAPHHEGLEASS
jgi:hypothetical protein